MRKLLLLFVCLLLLFVLLYSIYHINNMSSSCEEYIPELDKRRVSYECNERIDWNTFASDQCLHAYKVVILRNCDFAHGTLRVQQPCMLVLSECVEFNPNQPETWLDNNETLITDRACAMYIDPNRGLDWMPSRDAVNNEQYFLPEVSFAYGLGFFAAIAIESKDVIVDLNGYTLSQHPEHALQQRFFACIELADQPFLPLQGPSNFGNILKTADGVLIANGNIGLSSHHGIHGNNCNGVTIENVNFSDFEVAAISLNGSNNVKVVGVNVIQNRHDIPVLATYSASRFIKKFVLDLKDVSGPALQDKFDVLQFDMDTAFNSIILNVGDTPELFKNETGLSDGPAYGLLFNSKGVAVNGFKPTKNEDIFGNLSIYNTNISNLGMGDNEILALKRIDSTGEAVKLQVDTAGSVFQFFNGISELNGTKYTYAGTSLSEVQLELARLKMAYPDLGNYGTLKIDEGLIAWADDITKYFEHDGNNIMTLFNDDGSAYLSPNEVRYKVIGNSDAMHHVTKGAMGIRMDGQSYFNIKNVNISQIVNSSKPGSYLAGNYIKSHPSQTTINGFGGTDLYGAVISASCYGKIDNLCIDYLDSKNGSSVGTMIQNESAVIDLKGVNIKNVYSGSSVCYNPILPQYPNKEPHSRGLEVCNTCKCIGKECITVCNINEQPNGIKADNFIIKTCL